MGIVDDGLSDGLEYSVMSSDGASNDAPSPHPYTENRDLRVVLEIERGGPCFIDDLDGDVIDVEVRVDNGTCQSEVIVCESCDTDRPTTETCLSESANDSEHVITKYHTDEVCDHCPTAVFSAHGCIPHFLREGDRSFFIKTFLPSSAVVSDLVSDLNDIGSTVRLVSMTHTGSGEELAEEIYEVDVSVLTPKQREALQLAIDEGYYESGEEPSMASLAEQFDISTSAFSQRLSRAEQNVMGQFSDSN